MRNEFEWFEMVKEGNGSAAAALSSNISLPPVSDFGFRISNFFAQPKLRRVRRSPRIPRVVGGRDFLRELHAAEEERGHIEVLVTRRERREVRRAELEQPHGGAQAASVLRVVRVEVLLLQMDERAGDLDQPFVEQGVAVAAAEPELLEDVVGLVVAARVEAREVARVVRIERRFGGRRADEGGDAFAFFHRAAG